MNKVWEIAPRKYEDIIDQLLFNRGVFGEQKDEKVIDEFLHPDFESDLSDPFSLSGMKLAVDRIVKAKMQNERIGIFADYDADGTPGSALLYRAFRDAGVEAEVFIPSRNDGYGLSNHGIDYLIQKKCSVIISVDLGIRNITEAQYCKEKKVDLIITDHHLPADSLPPAFAVINPKLSNEGEQLDLCGCGVVYKLIQALSTHFREITPSFLKWNLDLVAISTIADMVTLRGENRTLTHFGLIVLRKTKNIGLQQLCKVAGLNIKDMNPYMVGFQIGPRINSPGRIDHATKAFELLVTEDEQEAKDLAGWLNEKNAERQRQMERVETEAALQVEKKKLSDNNLIVVSGDWPKGVLGPPASRLVEKYYRPVIVCSKLNDEYVGSARSVAGVNITDLLEHLSSDLVKYGGHSGAAGLTVAIDAYERFVRHAIEYANAQITSDQLVKRLNIDAELQPTDLTLRLVDAIERLEPFGVGNQCPVFLLSGVMLTQIRHVGETKKHLSAHVTYGTTSTKSICFNYERHDIIIDDHTKYDIVGTITRDTWNGRNALSLNIIDIRAHE